MAVTINTSSLDPRSTPQLFYTYFYNHARRLRMENLLYPEGFLEAPAGTLNHFCIQVAVLLLKPPHGGFRSETAVTYSRYKFVTVSLPNGTWRSFHFWNRRAAVSEAKRSPGSRGCLNDLLGLLESSIYNCFFKAGAMGVLIEICVKHPRGELE